MSNERHVVALVYDNPAAIAPEKKYIVAAKNMTIVGTEETCTTYLPLSAIAINLAIKITFTAKTFPGHLQKEYFQKYKKIGNFTIALSKAENI
ncbi:hypothetical protein [Calothrix sp. NIES-3974]|uniref:hypothetical protein n=1 Tax=Calothrix sp. NIES-3974 TaxID=2005462 RepID=UPI000BBC281A|nr:hypothetical protein [Calothrix sp. NIES-3974]